MAKHVFSCEQESVIQLPWGGVPLVADDRVNSETGPYTRSAVRPRWSWKWNHCIASPDTGFVSGT
jgi:hypothetical protein